MNSKEINKKVSDTFSVLEEIKEVQVSPFFGHKVLQQIKNETEEEVSYSYFSSKLQLAAIAIILIVNVTAILYAFNNSSSTISEPGIESFANYYELTSSSDSLLN